MEINSDYNYLYYNPTTHKHVSIEENPDVINDKDFYMLMPMEFIRSDDMEKVNNTPIKLAGKTSLDKSNNALNLASGATVTVRGGFKLTVTERGVMVKGGNFDDVEASYEAQDMADSLTALLRNACGIQRSVADGKNLYQKWTEDISKALSYFGINTSKDFTINGMRYSKDSDGIFQSEEKTMAHKAYEQMEKAYWEYRNSDNKISPKNFVRDYYLKTTPDIVKNAWIETEEETGIKPLYNNTWTGTFQRMAVEQEMSSKGNYNILGDTIESSVSAIKSILEMINLNLDRANAADVFLQNEKEFYSTLLAKIDK
ncbi:MAG: hypothetical protein IJ763_03990 [Lachnospiraceae bacterium]|nr:hypothetical protein [Lachnospiraceae bacterium]